MNRTALSVTILLAVAVGFSAPVSAMSPSESYLAYRKALAGAETMNDLKPHLDSAKFAETQAKSAAEQKKDLGIMKIFMIEATTDLKILSEKIDGNKATLKTKYCFDGDRSTATVAMVLEGEAWRVTKEKANMSSEKCE